MCMHVQCMMHACGQPATAAAERPEPRRRATAANDVAHMLQRAHAGSRRRVRAAAATDA